MVGVGELLVNVKALQGAQRVTELQAMARLAEAEVVVVMQANSS